MTRFIAILTISTLFCSPALAFPLKPSFPAASYDSTLYEAWEMLKSGNCESENSAEVSEARATELLKMLITEEINLDESIELTRMAAQFRCTLSAPGQKAFDALIEEARIRRFEFQALTQGKINLVVEATMPEEWEVLMQESEHHFPSASEPAKGAPILVIGCWVGIATGTGLIGACLNDVTDVHGDCIDGRLCTPNGPTNPICCDDKASSDSVNCVISIGQNGPDGDYNLCCL